MNGRGGDWTADFLDSLSDSRDNWLAWLRSKRAHRIARGIALGAILTGAIVLELKTSLFESLLFRAADRHITYHLAQGPNTAIHYPPAGPYDWTLGYARMPVFLSRLQAAGYQVKAQAHPSEFYSLISSSLYPVYQAKDQAGLQIVDQNGLPLYSFDRPQRVYKNYADVPPLVVQTLLFIENRHMLDPGNPHRNPAIEWDRFTKAILDYGLHAVDPRHHAVIGGSTLATQLEKIRHSPGGRTHSALEKFRQMAAATLAAYRTGSVTLQAQQKIVCDYINAIPLAASPGYGEVSGLGDGLWAWYGADISSASVLFRADEATLTNTQMRDRARAYRESLSLLLALRAPHYYLVENRKALTAQTDRYLRALAERGVISNRLRDLALAERLQPLTRVPGSSREDFVENKAQNAIRIALLSTLGVNSAYDLDRLDLTVRTSLDQPAQQNVTHFIEHLTDPKQAASAGLQQYQLLEQSDPSKVIYSFTLYERGAGANLLRIQTDNLNQPLNINQDTKPRARLHGQAADVD